MPEQAIRPEFIRLPAPKTRCPWTGMSRGELYTLTVPCAANQFRPPVPAKNRRKPGNLRGVWLIPFGALLAHIETWDTPGLATPSAAQPPETQTAADGGTLATCR